MADLRLASNFYSMWTIARQIAPVASSGIKVLEADGFKLHSFVSPTGTQPSMEQITLRMKLTFVCIGTFFFVITDPATYSADPELARLYELYADYVLKNPFYEIEQPINCSQFDLQLEAFVAQTNRTSLTAPFA